MTITLLLLAAFLAIVAAGSTLVALYDAAERVWSRGAAAVAAPVTVRQRTAGRRVPMGRRHPQARQPGTSVVAWPHLH